MQTRHEWVEDFKQFEAVMHALNELPAWDREATLRAFQTFGFDDASTPGNDMAFSHAETGVILRHDGDYVAIEFGDGDLRTAMGDLVHVLYQLGWRDAEVYHPTETMGILLTDIGISIPGNMDFDVRAAAAVAAISSFAETTSLVDRSLMALQSATGTSELGDLLLGELTSMGEELTGGAPAEAGAVEESPPTSHFANGMQLQGRASNYFEEEPPIVPTLGLPVAAMPQMPTPAPAPAAVEPLPIVVQPIRNVDAGDAVEQDADSPTERQTHLINEVPHRVARHTSVNTITGADIPSRFTAGNTTFILQTPGEISAGLGGEVVQLWPGAANQPWRWNLFGEIDPMSPWFAEALTRSMAFENPAHAACFEHGLIVWSQTAQPTLRGLLAELLRVEENTKTFGNLLLLIDEREFIRESAIRLAQLGVYAGRDSFIDSGTDAEAFSIRSLLVDPTKRTVVVHVDETDGALVTRIVGLLFAEASRWASSSRAERQSAAERDRAAKALVAEAERQEALAKGQRLALELTAQLAALQKSGIQLPLPASN